jgi:hypothetical protein
MADPQYAILTGNLKVADRDPVTGNPGPFTDVGEIPAFELVPAVEHKDGFSTAMDSPNVQDAHTAVQRALTGSVTCKERVALVLEMALHGTKSTVNSGTVTAQPFPSGILVNEERILPGTHPGVSSVVIRDSAVSPATLVAGTDYTVDAVAGTVTFLNLGTYVQPFKASYSYQARTDVTILSKTAKNKVFLFEGSNLQDGKHERILLHNVSTDPATKYEGKSADFNTYEMKIVVLVDKTKALDSALGQYGVHSLLPT